MLFKQALFFAFFLSPLHAMDSLYIDKQELYSEWFARLKTQQAHKAARALQQSLVVDRHLAVSAYASGQQPDELIRENDRDVAEMLVAGDGFFPEQSCTIL